VLEGTSIVQVIEHGKSVDTAQTICNSSWHCSHHASMTRNLSSSNNILLDRLTIALLINEKHNEGYYHKNRRHCPSTDRGCHKPVNETKQQVGVEDHHQIKASR
jgi:hypothetical protein